MNTDHERFTDSWQHYAPRVMAYARRHVGAHDAHDVVSETFLTAWRRFDAVPDPPLAWLLVTARQVISNRQRSSRRLQAVADRIALLESVATSTTSGSDDAALRRREALEQLATLSEDHREALLLVAWDGLSHEQAAAVLGLRPATFRQRIRRARAALTEATGTAPKPLSPRVTHPQPILATTKDYR